MIVHCVMYNSDLSAVCCKATDYALMLRNLLEKDKSWKIKATRCHQKKICLCQVCECDLLVRWMLKKNVLRGQFHMHLMPAFKMPKSDTQIKNSGIKMPNTGVLKVAIVLPQKAHNPLLKCQKRNHLNSKKECEKAKIGTIINYYYYYHHVNSPNTIEKFPEEGELKKKICIILNCFSYTFDSNYCICLVSIWWRENWQ